MSNVLDWAKREVEIACDDKVDYSYLTTMSESTEQTNSIMLDLILRKYSRKYRRFKRQQKKGEK